MPKSYLRLLVVLAILFVPVLLHAQATGTINGSVYDSTGALVPGAAVTVTNTGTNQTRSAITDGSGNYVLPLLPVGNYNVRVEKEGFNAISAGQSDAAGEHDHPGERDARGSGHGRAGLGDGKRNHDPDHGNQPGAGSR